MTVVNGYQYKKMALPPSCCSFPPPPSTSKLSSPPFPHCLPPPILYTTSPSPSQSPPHCPHMDNQTSSDFPHSSGVSPALAFFGAVRNQAFRLPEPERLSRVSSNLSVMTDGSLENIEFPLSSRFLVPQNGGPCGEFAVGGSLGGTVGIGESVCRKRKEIFCNGNAGEAPVSLANRQHWKLAEVESTNLKRSKSIGATSGKGKSECKQENKENSGVRGVSSSTEKPGKDNASKTSENSTKDYIHVRARRGQATDSHSLAERVRREKISERMKFLQDLVPGCNKVTGKAVMLDEIINYVQSLQRQVEFLSMKLATVNPHLEFNMENLLQKNIQQLRGCLPSNMNHPMDVSALTMPFSPQPSQSNPVQCNVTNGMYNKIHHINSLDASLRQTLHPQSTADSFEYAHSQLGTLWEDDLQSVVQMGILKNQKTTFSQQQFHVPTNKKLER